LSAAKNPRILDFVRQQSGLVASVCTGAFVLAAAGVLKNLPATTHHDFIGALAKDGIDVRPNERFLMTERVATAAGVTSGIDLALALVEQFWDKDLAKRVAENIEWGR
jgi:cyclohexyl-isocyanide hydratase